MALEPFAQAAAHDRAVLALHGGGDVAHGRDLLDGGRIIVNHEAPGQVAVHGVLIDELVARPAAVGAELEQADLGAIGPALGVLPPGVGIRGEAAAEARAVPPIYKRALQVHDARGLGRRRGTFPHDPIADREVVRRVKPELVACPVRVGREHPHARLVAEAREAVTETGVGQDGRTRAAARERDRAQTAAEGEHVSPPVGDPDPVGRAGGSDARPHVPTAQVERGDLDHTAEGAREVHHVRGVPAGRVAQRRDRHIGVARAAEGVAKARERTARLAGRANARHRGECHVVAEEVGHAGGRAEVEARAVEAL